MRNNSLFIKRQTLTKPVELVASRRFCCVRVKLLIVLVPVKIVVVCDSAASCPGEIHNSMKHGQ